MIGEGDFSERLTRTVDRIIRDFPATSAGEPVALTSAQVAELVYKHELPKLRTALSEYLRLKKSVWILFDNIDKGWPTQGVEASDVLIVRSLLDASRKVEHALRKEDCPVNTLIFLRNDVYELLIDETPDRGKDSRVSVEWTDGEQLKEMLRRRFVFNGAAETSTFYETWRQICTPLMSGEDSADYLVQRSLMRPRNLLNFINHCKSYAINVGHAQIEQEDILKAERHYSADLGNEIALEIRDVFPEAGDLLYLFLDNRSRMTLGDIYDLFSAAGYPSGIHSRIVDTLLWFSFLGVVGSNDSVNYSYSVYYDMKKLRKLAKEQTDKSVEFVIHKAFWPFLELPEA